uniref:Transmembrane protein 192 n=1 Tax=Seriola lalandi dorsalis TaxID=1841481 RepID=A0A3B4WWT0_SERLL
MYTIIIWWSFRQAGTSVDMTRSVEEESLVDGPLISADALHSAIRRQFQTTSVSLSLLSSFFQIVYVVLSVCVSVLCVLKFGQAEVCASVLHNVSGDSVIVYGKVCLWVLVLVFTRCMQHHHSQARRRGYLRFYRETQGLNHLPLSIHSAGTTARVAPLLLMYRPVFSTRWHSHCSLMSLCSHVQLTEHVFCPFLVKVMRFNREKAAPDVSQEECSHTYSVTSLPTETGFREGSCLEEVVERQADLIEYLKQHNTLLSKRLLNLTAQH